MKKIFFNRISVLFFLVSFCLYSQNQQNNKSAIFYLNKANNTNVNNKDSLFYYLDKGYNLALIDKNDSLQLLITHKSFLQSYKFRMFKKAYRYNKKLDSLAQNLKDTVALYQAAFNFGRLENVNDNSSKSTEFYKKALTFASALNNNTKKLCVFGNIGVNYMNEEQYELANTFFLNSMNIIERLNEKETNDNIENIAMTLTNLVYSYTELNMKEKAYLYLNKADKVFSTRYFEGKVEINELKGITYGHFKDYDKAIYFFKKQLEISKKRNDKIAIEHCLLNLAELHNNIKAYDKASSYFNAYEMSQQANENEDEILSDLKQIYQIGLNSYKGAKQYEKALKYAELLNKTLDTLHKIEVSSTFAEYGKKYQTDKKIKENELLKKENKIKYLEVQRQKTARNYLLLLSVLGLITLSITYFQLRLNVKKTKILALQNTTINNQKIELEKSNANKQRLFSIIAHDLVNPFNAILGYTSLLEEDYDSFDEAQRKQFIATINKYATSNYNLTRTLLDWAKVQQDRLVVNKTNLNCKEIVDSAIQPFQVLAEKKQIEVVINVPATIIVEADQNMMQTVVGNLFVNAVKFTPQGGTITFNLDKNKDGTIALEIEDNGIGMTQEQLNNLFDITKASSLKGTNNEKGNGLGLILCKELMELQKGTLEIFSQINKGSKAVLTI